MTVSNLNYLSKVSGIGGTIKNSPSDFIVEEIALDGQIFELNKVFEIEDKEPNGKFIHFILQKTNWTTNSALAKIAERLHISTKAFNAAGMKDKISISTQLASVCGVKKEDLLSLNSKSSIKDIQINGASYSNERIKIGDLLGNRFTIKVRNLEISDPKNQTDQVEKTFTETKGLFPNYFGEQRFGSNRKNTHMIGKSIAQGNLQTAVEFFLFDTEGEENELAKQARKELEETQDFSAALRNFPKSLALERKVIFQLSKKPTDYIAALRALPRNILLLFVHSLQSQIFNDLLSSRLEEGIVELEKGEYFCTNKISKNGLSFPSIDTASEEGIIAGKIIGYETTLNDREKDYLEKNDLKKENFKISYLPEISSKGTYRPLFSPLANFDFKPEPDFSTFNFCLQSGSYATMAMREFLDKKPTHL